MSKGMDHKTRWRWKEPICYADVKGETEFDTVEILSFLERRGFIRSELRNKDGSGQRIWLPLVDIDELDKLVAKWESVDPMTWDKNYSLGMLAAYKECAAELKAAISKVER